ncbi:MAG TPA: DUF1566 domain-containing protein [Sedimentisphaerales bacterium]|nr:DUF1566 domain-containing protein [Sedimentisphaerales bacterium]
MDTGQSECYNNKGLIACPRPGEAFYGQDAQYQGIQPAYRDNRDGTVTDLNTGLIWQKTPDFDNLVTWYDAVDYADDLELAGYNDWRLPTIKELYSITDFGGNQHTKTPYLNTKYFDFEYPNPSTGLRFIDAQYWSNNFYAGRTMNGDLSAFGFNFADGRIKSYPANVTRGPLARRYVRCVRGNPDYGKNKFLDNGNGTITDSATGLMWQKKDNGTAMNWRQALSYAEKLDYTGHDDWRLPNAKELQSIVDYTRSPGATKPNMRTAAIDPIFNLTETESWFWTSTTHGDHKSHAVYICFGRALAYDFRSGEFTKDAHGAGAQRSDPKAGNPINYPRGLGPQRDQIRIYNYVRCVRDVSSAAG